MTIKAKDIIFFLGMTILSVVAFGYGWSIIPSPMEQTQRAFDAQRTQDLQSIQYSIDTYTSNYNKLPDHLEQIRDTSYSRDLAFTDPETQKPYEYSIINIFTYKICATFATNTKEQTTNKKSISYDDSYFYENREYNHPSGYFCFEKIVPNLKTPPSPTPSVAIFNINSNSVASPPPTFIELK